MNVEIPPISDKVLSSYLIRTFNTVKSAIESAKPYIVASLIKNPTLGRFYLAERTTEQFSSAGMYYYNGNTFVKLAEVGGATLELGTLHTQAFYGDYGQLAYEHINKTDNPHNVTKEQIGLPLVDNTPDIDKPVSSAVYNELNKYVLKTIKINGKQLITDINLTTADVPPTVNRRYLTNAEYTRSNTAASGTNDGYLKSTDWTTFNGKQDALGFTPENVANKAVTMTGNEASITAYLAAKATYDWATGLFTPKARTITINSVSYDLSADRSWTIVAGISDAPNDSSAYVRSGLAWAVGYTKTAIDSLLANKITSNTAITGATKTKISYDSKGLVTSGADATTTDIAEGTNLYFTETRVRSTPLTGLSASVGSLLSTDTIIQAFGKIAGLIDNDAWTTYTPVSVGSGFTIGNGTAEGRYKKIGKTVFYTITITFGSTTTFVSSWNFLFPTAYYSDVRLVYNNARILYRDVSASAFYDGCTLGSSMGYYTAVNSKSVLTTTTPFTWASGDQIYISGFYEST